MMDQTESWKTQVYHRPHTRLICTSVGMGHLLRVWASAEILFWNVFVERCALVS